MWEAFKRGWKEGWKEGGRDLRRLKWVAPCVLAVMLAHWFMFHNIEPTTRQIWGEAALAGISFALGEISQRKEM